MPPPPPEKKTKNTKRTKRVETESPGTITLADRTRICRIESSNYSSFPGA